MICGRRCWGLVLVSPASPLKAIKVLLFKLRVLSSEALRIVAPLIAAFDAAMRVKSFPVIPRRTSLCSHVSYIQSSAARPSCVWIALNVHLGRYESIFGSAVVCKGRLKVFRVVYRGISKGQLKKRRVVYSINSLFMRLQPLFVTADVPGTAPWH